VTAHDHCELVRIFTVQTVLPLSATVSVTMSSTSSSSWPGSSSPSHSVTSDDVPVSVGNAFFVGEEVWSIVGAASPRVRTAKLMPGAVTFDAAADQV
jgi:hypothetical protein